MPQTQLKINLLPEGIRKSPLSPVEQFHRTPLMLLMVLVMVIGPVLLWVPIHIDRRKLAQLNSKIQALSPKREEVDRIQQLVQRLRSQQAGFEALKKGQGSWSKRLNTLSDVVPDGLWFTELSLDQSKGLVIQGSAIATDGPGMATVTGLVQDLKSNKEFGDIFKQINIESIKRVQDGAIDIVQFTVTCNLGEPPAS